MTFNVRIQKKPAIGLRVLPRIVPNDATVEIGTVTTLPAGSPATVDNVGTPSAVILDFGIPQGSAGAPGAPGVVQSVVAGTNITVNNADPANPVVNATNSTELANPSASVGLTAVNGVATTAMRSDAAPPLSQSISPTMTGNWTFNPASGDAITANPASGTTAKALSLTQTGPSSTSALTAPFAYNTLAINADAVTGTASYHVAGMDITHFFGGSNAKGSRIAFNGHLYQNAATSASNPNRDYVAVVGLAESNSGDGGTNTGAGALGSLYGVNPAAFANAGALNMAAVVGGEVDVGIATGASARSRIGYNFVSTGNLQGASVDTAIMFSGTTAVSWQNGVLLSNVAGGSPIATTGAVIATDGSANTIATGIDLSSYTITGNFLKSTGFSVSGAGVASVNSLSLTTGGATPAGAGLVASGATAVDVYASGKAASRFTAGSTAVNFPQFNASPTGGGVSVTPVGSDTDVTFLLASKNAGGVVLGTASGSITQFAVTHTASAARYMQVTGSVSGSPILSTAGGGGINIAPGAGGVHIGSAADPGSNNLSAASGFFASKAPTTLTGTSGSVGANDSSVIINASGTFTLTLPSASGANAGRWLHVKSIAAQTVNSASSNVAPIGSATAGSAILTNTAGKWAVLQSDGTNWITMAAN